MLISLRFVFQPIRSDPELCSLTEFLNRLGVSDLDPFEWIIQVASKVKSNKVNNDASQSQPSSAMIYRFFLVPVYPLIDPRTQLCTENNIQNVFNI